MGVTQRQTYQLQPRRLREWVPGSSLLQQTIQTSSTFSSSSTSLSNKTTTTVEMAVSKIRQNYHEDCEALINKQINMEFYASYVYLSMSSYFNRDDQALHGFAAHFKTESGEERAHGMKLMEYQSSVEEELSSRTLSSRPLWNGEPHLKPWKPLLSWKRRSTRAFSTCTRWPETRAADTSATSSSPSTWASRWRASRPSGT